MAGVEQIGSPMELYNNPVNQFVAGFLGSPAMNFLPGALIGKGPEPDRRHPAPKISYRTDNGPLTGKVIHVEHLGGDTNLIASVNEQDFTVRLFGQHDIAPDQQISLGFDEDKIRLFDQNGMRAR